MDQWHVVATHTPTWDAGPAQRPMRSLISFVVALAVGVFAGVADTGATASRPARLSRGAERAGAGGPYAFLLEHEGGRPVTWDACRPIRYVLNLQDAPQSARTDVEAGVRRVSEATGLRFEFAGFTDERPSIDRKPRQPRYGTGWAPVLIVWSPIVAARMGAAGEAIGVAQPIPMGTGEDIVYVTGQVVMESMWSWQSGFLGRASTSPVLLHELGHLVGLNHVNDPMQLMQSGGDERLHLIDYGAGDLEGLAAVGGHCR